MYAGMYISYKYITVVMLLSFVHSVVVEPCLNVTLVVYSNEKVAIAF